ncbi:hypothetical protein KVT40_001844 [Elsinoe batatas]|uniref:Uncharacterized protein n=1 Tax=Elsinoe batatas TaxID=2601811 RepID=A0A8K0PFE7_9PEZI|nr:hypothetical protein KVT40_001844 [Elsinoe batatas]
MGSRLRGLKIPKPCSSMVLSDQGLTTHQHSLDGNDSDDPQRKPRQKWLRITSAGKEYNPHKLKQPSPSTPTPTMRSAGDFTLQVPIGRANRHIKLLPKNPPATRRGSQSLSHRRPSPVSVIESSNFNPSGAQLQRIWQLPPARRNYP